MKRLFAVWNQGYRQVLVVADDQTEALTLLAKRRFIRRANMFRKLQEQTDIATEEQQAFLDGDRSGVLTQEEGVLVLT